MKSTSILQDLKDRDIENELIIIPIISFFFPKILQFLCILSAMYRRYVLPALLGLALSSALPPSLPVLAIDYSKVERLDTTWKQYSFEEFCNDFNPEGNNDPSLAEPLWKDHGVGKWFDSWLANTPDKRRWTETMDSEVNRYVLELPLGH